MERDGSWHISPAYDVCFVLKNATNAETHHIFSVRGKHEDITIQDLLDFAKENNIKDAESYIEKVREALREFPALAAANGIATPYIRIIQSRLNELSSGLLEPFIEHSPIRFELSDSGNIHLYARINNREIRRVITQKNKSYEVLLDDMKRPLTTNRQEEIIKDFFGEC